VQLAQERATQPARGSRAGSAGSETRANAAIRSPGATHSRKCSRPIAVAYAVSRCRSSLAAIARPRTSRLRISRTRTPRAASARSATSRRFAVWVPAATSWREKSRTTRVSRHQRGVAAMHSASSAVSSSSP
jgi:hypothetical protein